MSAEKKRLASDRDWYGYLTLENAEAVADRIRSMIGDGQRYTWVAANEIFGYKPEIRTGQVAKRIEFVSEKLSDGRSWAHLLVRDAYGTWGISTTAADQAAAHAMDKKDATFLRFEYGRLTIEHYAPAGNHLWWAIAVEDHEEAEQQFREQIAEEVREKHGPFDVSGEDGEFDEGVLAAIRTVRGEAS